MKTLLVINLLAVLAVGYIAYTTLSHVAQIEWVLMQIINAAPGQDS